MSRGRQIARLKLKPVEPTHVARYLLDWDARTLSQNPLSFPSLASENLFANSKPMAVEIGAGSGEYLCHLAAQQPDWNFLGIEVSRRAALSAVALAAGNGLGNLMVLRADFRWLVPLLPREAWGAVYLHFPDPPEKRRDAKRELFIAAFLDRMSETLTAGGQISVVSDRKEYFFRMLTLAENHSAFTLAHQQPYMNDFDPIVKSRFQRHWESKGITPLRFVLRRN